MSGMAVCNVSSVLMSFANGMRTDMHIACIWECMVGLIWTGTIASGATSCHMMCILLLAETIWLLYCCATCPVACHMACMQATKSQYQHFWHQCQNFQGLCPILRGCACDQMQSNIIYTDSLKLCQIIEMFKILHAVYSLYTRNLTAVLADCPEAL